MPESRRLVVSLAFLVLLVASAGAAPLAVYDDQLRNGFEDWSWASHDMTQAAVVHSGTRAISMQPADWGGLYFHRPAGIDVATNGSLEFWVRGGSPGGQQLRVAVYAYGSEVGNAELEAFVAGGSIPAGSWAKATVPFSALGVTSGAVDGLVLMADGSAAQPTVYLDDLVLLDTYTPPATIAVTVDPTADRRPISPLIYGVNFGTTPQFAALPYPLRRWGGNRMTRYNYLADVSNTASDWFFMNIPEGGGTGLPGASTANLWLDETLGAGAEAIMTVPMIGWTPRDRAGRWGFSVAKYGAQQRTEAGELGFGNADAGNGVLLNGTRITWNDPLDTSMAIGPSFVTGWVQHLVGRHGAAGEGGVNFYALDNEPGLWHETHRDVHPQPVTYDELWTRTLDYATAVKAADPQAQVLGPAAWGWCEYFHSAADNCQSGADQAAHGGMPLLEWYLAQNRARELATGVRPVDYLDIHYYPQVNGVALTDDEAVAGPRLQSLRSLWDPAYVDGSWIDVPVRLIPRMKAIIAERSPGVKLAITEYNWGGDTGISSALAQAELLAIFGREGVDLATRWVAPVAPSRVLEAFRLFLDYDGLGHSLAGESVRATSANVDEVGAYAILRSGTEVAVLLFNKATTARQVDATFSRAVTGQAQLFRFDAASPLAPAGLLAVSGTAVGLELPARSATLLVAQLAEPVSAVDERLPAGPALLTSAPNPFNPSTSIAFELPLGGPVRLSIHDVRGQLVATLVDGVLEAGRHEHAWNGRGNDGQEAPSGVYLCRLETSAGVLARKMSLVR